MFLLCFIDHGLRVNLIQCIHLCNKKLWQMKHSVFLFFPSFIIFLKSQCIYCNALSPAAVELRWIHYAWSRICYAYTYINLCWWWEKSPKPVKWSTCINISLWYCVIQNTNWSSFRWKLWRRWFNSIACCRPYFLSNNW